MYNDITWQSFEGQIDKGTPVIYYPVSDSKDDAIHTVTKSKSFIIPEGWSNAGMHAVYLQSHAGYVAMQNVEKDNGNE